MILTSIIFLIIGIALLVVGADTMVRGAASMAKKWKISSIVIGLTVVAFGTSAPELVVNLFSAFKGSTDLAVANVVGSNLANVLLILGVGASIRTLNVKKGTTFKEIPFAFLAVVLVAIMGNDSLMNGDTVNVLNRADGLAFLCFFIIFIYYTYGISKVSGEGENIETYPWGKSIAFFVLGITGLVLGGKLIVDNAILLASAAGMSQTLIGLTIVAIGTSLPELATTIVALRKGHTDLAIGNAVGSNIFNVFWILGLTAVVEPLPFNVESNNDVLFSVLATLLLFAFIYTGDKKGERHKLKRIHGVLFLCMYVGYLAYAMLR